MVNLDYEQKTELFRTIDECITKVQRFPTTYKVPIEEIPSMYTSAYFIQRVFENIEEYDSSDYISTDFVGTDAARTYLANYNAASLIESVHLEYYRVLRWFLTWLIEREKEKEKEKEIEIEKEKGREDEQHV